MINRLIITLLLLFSSNMANAQDNFKVSLKASGQYALLSFGLEDGAKLYWRHPGELGLATKFSFEGSSNLKSAKLVWPTPELYTDHNISNYVYQHKVDFPIIITAIDSDQPVDLKVQTNFILCADTCDTQEVILSTIVHPHEPILAETIAALTRIPVNKKIEFKSAEEKMEDGKHWLEVRFTYHGEFNKHQLFIDLPEYINFNPLNYSISHEGNNYLLKIPFSFTGKAHNLESAYINLNVDNEGVAEYEYIAAHTAKLPFMMIIMYALLGGLILNIMPCVLPILALKLLQITKLESKDLNRAKYDLLAQASGIIFSFVILAIITYFVQQMGYQAGLGMHFQQPSYLISMVIILELIALNLLSSNEVHLSVPHFIVKALPANSTGILGFFFTGILATMLAVPCTAPFVTVAVGFALTADFIELFTIFIFIGIGMALPYLVMAMTPRIGRFLPKPGKWMQQFRKLLGIMTLLTCFWMLYIISTQISRDAAFVVFLLLLLINFLLRQNGFNKIIRIIIFVILVSLCYILPLNMHQKNLSEQQVVEEVWQEFRPEMIAKLINEGHIVVIDLTASWCATCNINKFSTLNNNAVMEFMKKHNVMGMRASVNQSSDNNPDIMRLMRKYQHFGVPLNVIYSKKFPDGILLPTILLPNMFITAINKARL